MIFRTTIQSPVGALRLFASDKGLRAVLWPQDDDKQLKLGVESVERADHPFLLQAAQQLAEYFASGRRVFDVPLDPVGTRFQLRAWSYLREIPYGTTRTYGAQAAAMGQPKASRAVGAANGRNPLSIFVPCHRVIGANGSLTGFAGGLETKRFLLALEAQHVGRSLGLVQGRRHQNMVRGDHRDPSLHEPRADSGSPVDRREVRSLCTGGWGVLLADGTPCISGDQPRDQLFFILEHSEVKFMEDTAN